MTSIRDLILRYLADHPEGATDSELTAALNLKYHQQANSRCRELAAQGQIERRPVEGTIRNFLVGTAPVPPPPRAAAPGPAPQPVLRPARSGDRPWFWEGHVQDTVVKYLQAQGYRIVRVADTAAHETGKDIVAQGPAGLLWVTVKGYPEGTDKTNPSTQARHWFAGALFDIVTWRGEDTQVGLALALPDFPSYRKLAAKTAWLQPAAHFSVLWVGQDGTVVAEALGK